MPSEGKVGSLFVEFRTNLNQFVSDMQRMVNEVRSFDSTVGSASKRFSDLGHLGSSAIKEIVSDLGGLTAGLNTVNTFTQQVSNSLADMGHLGSAAAREVVSDLGGLTSGLSTVNTFTRSAAVGFTEMGHLGTAAVAQISSDLGRLTAGLNSANTFSRQAAQGIGDMGHLGSAAVRETVNDLGNLTAGLNAANTFSRQAGSGIGDIGHLGGAAIVETVNDLGNLTAGLNAANTFSRQAAQGVGDLGHLGSAAVRETINDLGNLTSGLNSANTFAREATTGVSDLGHLGGAAINNVAAATATFGERIRLASTEIRQFDRVFSPIKQRLNEIGFALSVGLTVPILAVGAYALKTGKEFETAFSGVRQTLNASEEDLSKLRKELIQLSTTTPVSAVGLAEIATTVAKLGVEAPNVAKFASTIAELTTVTRLSGEEAANFLGRFANITHLPQDQIHNLASTLFELGKAFPAVENEITNFSLRVAKTGTFVGLSSGEILAFATALASVGVTAESGGTAISRVLAEMAKASENLNSTRLAEFAAVAGKTAKEFSEQFKTNASGAVLDFVKGLQRIREEGGNVFTTLDTLKLSNVRTRETLLALALGSDQLARALGLQNEEFQKDGELTRAYGEKTKTTAAQIAIFEHQVQALGISLFDAIAPTINNIVLPAMKRLVDEGIKPALQAFESLSPTGQHVVEVMLLVAAATGPALLAITKLVSLVEGLVIIFDRVKTAELAERLVNLGGIASKLVEPLTLVGLAIGGWELEKVIIDSLGLTAAFDADKSSAVELGRAVENLAGAFGKFAIKQITEDFKNLKSTMDVLVGPIKEVAIAIVLPQLIKSGIEINAVAAYVNSLSAAMDKAGESANSLPAAMARVAAAANNSLPAAMARVLAASKQNAGPDHIGPSVEELAAQGKAAEALAKEHQKLIEKFTDELAPANALNKDLDYLRKTFSDDQIVSVYSKKIVDAAEAQRNHGIEVVGTTNKLYDQAKALEKVGEILKELAKTPVPTISSGLSGMLGEHGLTTSFTKNPIPGMVEPGNTEIFNRPIVYNPDKSVSTTLSSSFEQEGLEILIPTVFNGIKHTMEQAIAHYEETGEHLGKFVNAAYADAYATALHNAQEAAGHLQGNAVEVKAFENFDKAKEQINELNKTLQNLSFLPADQLIGMFDADLDTAAASSKKYKITLDVVTASLLAQRKEMEQTAAGTKAWQDAVNIGVKTADDMAQQINIASNAVAKMEEAGFADATIMDILGTVIDNAAKNAKILGVALDPVIANLARMRAEMLKDIKDAKDLEKEMSRIAAKIVTDLASGIADAIFGSGSFSDIAVKIGEDFAKAFLKAVLATLLEPMIKAFEDLGKQIGKKLAEALGSAAPIVGGIILAVLAAIAVIKALGNSHLFANQFVKETQNPFGKSLSQFLAAQDAITAAGRQTYEGAKQAEQKVKDMWQGFLDDAEKFGEKGRKQATVVQQAIETLSPTMRRVIFEIQAQIDSLKPPSIRAIEFVNAVAAYRNQVTANTAEHIADLQMQAASIDEQIHFVMAQIAAQDELGGSTAELNAKLQDLIYQWDAVQDALNPVIPNLYSFAEAVNAVSTKLVPDKTEGFLDQVLNATSGAGNLEEALGILEAIHTPVAIIIDRLGGDLENFANALTESGLPIPPLIEKYLKLKKAGDTASGEMPRIANSLSKLVGDAVDKLRAMANGGDLAQSILDALGRLLTGLPSPSKGTTDVMATMDSAVKEAVDKVRTVTEQILAAIQANKAGVPDTRTAAQDYIHTGTINGSSQIAFQVPTLVPVATQVFVTIQDNETITNEFMFTDEISREVVRDRVIPEITESLGNNTDSVREKWIKILRGAGFEVVRR